VKNGVVNFVVFGSPKPKGNKSAFPIRRKDGRLGVAVREGKPGGPYEEWRRRVETIVQEVARQTEPIGGPVVAKMEFLLPRPKSAPKSRVFPDVRPDADKLARCILDSVSGVLIQDDAQVVELSVRKLYTENAPRAEVWLMEATP
jgi:crossover junction endodeoxyribonuclease RusA